MHCNALQLKIFEKEVVSGYNFLHTFSYELNIIFKNSFLCMHKENGKWFKTLNFTANWLKSCECFSIEMEFPGRKIC